MRDYFGILKPPPLEDTVVEIIGKVEDSQTENKSENENKMKIERVEDIQSETEKIEDPQIKTEKVDPQFSKKDHQS